MTRAPALGIALVGPLPPPSGGMANQVRQLAELLRGESIAVEVVQVNAPYRPVWIGRMRGLRALFRLIPYLAHLWRAAGRNDLVHVMANSGWSWHLFAAPAILLAKLRGKAVVVHYHGGEAEAFFEHSFVWVKPILKQAHAIMAPSGFLGQVFAKRGFTAHVVPNIVNLERFTPDAGSGPSGPTGPHILVARNLERLYDNASAIRAFALVRARHPTARLTVTGSGPERAALERQAQALGVAQAVTFTGRIEHSEMPALYKTANIVLNPSLVDNAPISILEALASGVPVVSTDVGGVPFLVRHEVTALLVSPGNHAAMARACLRLLAEPGLAQNLVRTGQDLASEFAWDRVRGRLFEVYNSALGGRRLPLAEAR